MTRTKFCSPPLSDGRDLTLDIIKIKQEKGEWSPLLSLYEVI